MIEYFIINTTISLWAWMTQRFLLTDARHQFTVLMLALFCWLIPFGYFQFQADVALLTSTQPIVSQIKEPMATLVKEASLEWTWTQVLLVLMVLGLLRFASDLKQMIQQHKAFQSQGQATDFSNVYTVKGLNNACVTGFKPSLIWVDETLFHSEAKQAILAHEQQHIKNKDPYWLLLIVLIERLFWFNPLVWLLTQNSKSCIERRCDQACQETMNQGEYQSQLAKTLLLMNKQNSKLTNFMSQNPNNIQRIQHLNKEHSMMITQKIVFTVTTLITLAASFAVLADNIRPPIGANQILLDVKYSIDGGETKVMSVLAEDGKEALITISGMGISLKPHMIRQKNAEAETDTSATNSPELQVLTALKIYNTNDPENAVSPSIVSMVEKWAAIDFNFEDQGLSGRIESKASVAN